MGMALVSDLSDLSDLSDKMGAPVFALMGYAVASHVIPRGFAVPLGGVTRVLICRRGMPGFFDGCGGMRIAGAWRLHGNFWEFLGIFERGMGAPLYTPWVCLSVWGWGAGEKCTGGNASSF